MDEGTHDVCVPRSPGERRAQIAELLRESSFLHVEELSDRFGVSEVTTRSDLEALAVSGHLRRVRGGAVPVLTRPRPERSYVESLGQHATAKRAIGAAVAATVVPGESIGIDVGTTTTAVAQALAERTDLTDVVVVTNSLTIPLVLEDAVPRLTVVVTGGTLRPLQHSLVDPLGDLVLSRLQLDTAVIGCTGVSAEHGVSNVNLPEAAAKQRLLERALRRVVVADGSKIGQRSLAPVCDLDHFDVLVTDPTAPDAEVDRLRDAGIDVRICL